MALGPPRPTSATQDIAIAGAGIIGLSLALELHHRGARVTVFDRGPALAQASTAAAGMLAAHDPDNPPLLRPLAEFSLSLFPAFLERIESLSGIAVPFQTRATLQSLPCDDRTSPLANLTHLLPQLTPGRHRFTLLEERSIDPRQLASALLAAVRATSIELHQHTALPSHSATPLINCTGACAAQLEAAQLEAAQLEATQLEAPALPVTPSKGQMLAVALPPGLTLDTVVRTPAIYIVPRTTGPGAGRAIIGATVEEVGFDTTVHPQDIARLHARASELLPHLSGATILESWAGLRPATPDRLPLLGELPHAPGRFVAAGHYRNGILLAPATAHLLAQLILGESPAIDLAPFHPARFTR